MFEKFRSEVLALSSDLITQVEAAWRGHVLAKVGKGLPDSERPVEGQEEAVWDRLVGLVQNVEWKQECLRRDEKFDMYFSSAVRPCHKQRRDEGFLLQDYRLAP